MHKTLLLLLLVALPAWAQNVYTYKDNNGNTVYTNEPPPNTVKAENVKLRPLQTIPSQSTSTNKVIREVQPVISQVVLSGIPNDESLRANNGNFSVTITMKTSPSLLSSSYQFQLLLDGKPYGSIQSSPVFALANIDRGSHTLVGQVLNKGNIVASSNAESFTIQRISANSPARHPKPQPR